MSGEIGRHMVTLTVVVEADGRGLGDAMNVARNAVAQALEGGELTTHTYTGIERTVSVRSVDEIGAAFRNGDLAIQSRSS